jgi:hypothetical protein
MKDTSIYIINNFAKKIIYFKELLYAFMGLFDFGYKPPTKKQRKRKTVRRNQARGRAAEDQAMTRDTMLGYEVKRTGRGHDYVRRRRDFLTGRVTRTEYIEVKSGNAVLSPLQKKTRKKKKGHYKIIREDPLFFDLY